MERKHGVYQDRFVKELRLQGATTIAKTNIILRGEFVEKLNNKFAHELITAEDFHDPPAAPGSVRHVLFRSHPQKHFYQLHRGDTPLSKS